MTWIVYEVLHRESGRSYIGCTSKGKEVRFYQHAGAPTPIGDAIKEFGADAFDLIELSAHDDRLAAFRAERATILARATEVPHGYNRSNKRKPYAPQQAAAVVFSREPPPPASLAKRFLDLRPGEYVCLPGENPRSLSTILSTIRAKWPTTRYALRSGPDGPRVWRTA